MQVVLSETQIIDLTQPIDWGLFVHQISNGTLNIDFLKILHCDYRYKKYTEPILTFNGSEKSSFQQRRFLKENRNISRFPQFTVVNWITCNNWMLQLSVACSYWHCAEIRSTVIISFAKWRHIHTYLTEIRYIVTHSLSLKYKTLKYKWTEIGKVLLINFITKLVGLQCNNLVLYFTMRIAETCYSCQLSVLVSLFWLLSMQQYYRLYGDCSVARMRSLASRAACCVARSVLWYQSMMPLLYPVEDAMALTCLPATSILHSYGLYLVTCILVMPTWNLSRNFGKSLIIVQRLVTTEFYVESCALSLSNDNLIPLCFIFDDFSFICSAFSFRLNTVTRATHCNTTIHLRTLLKRYLLVALVDTM